MIGIKKGYVHVYTGNGKGKTTAALGQALRAGGSGLTTLIVMFMKDFSYGEIKCIELLSDWIRLEQYGNDAFVIRKKKPDDRDIAAARHALRQVREAMFYDPLPGKKLQCNICNHRCRIPDGEIGICGVRKNIQGRLFSLVYGKIISANIDPIEKKPLFHFLPGSKAFSIGTMGCNFHCKHCQNFDISQQPHEHKGQIIGKDHTPELIVATAKAAKCQTVAYTYNEPTVFYEFAYDTSKFARNAGMKNIFVSNG
jgi:hypothetical protein